MSCGIPQGSILGPTLFIMYVNDLCNISSHLKSILFADDTSFLVEGSDLLEMCTNVSTEMNKLYTDAPRYNAVVGVHDIGPRCKRGALGVPISATRELLNNSDCRPLHQVHERCRSPMCL